jgi:hypothetical protein
MHPYFKMALYKRNQVEEAISRVLDPNANALRSDLTSRLKRLLDTDRTLGRAPRSADPERANFAFYSAEAPGSGVEVWFSEYEAFALLNGVRLMSHGWPQRFAVMILRRVKGDLETHHARVLKQDPKVLFDEQALRRSAKPGDWALNNTDPVFLTIVSRPPGDREQRGETIDCAVCRGVHETMVFVQETGNRGGAGSMFEVATVAHKLSIALKETAPRSRGRAT